MMRKTAEEDSEHWLANANGHQLIRDEDGLVDFWVLDAGYHNGPGCAACYESWCHHCVDAPTEPCTAIIDVEAVVVVEDERRLIE